jgi:hypothetical protein
MRINGYFVGGGVARWASLVIAGALSVACGSESEEPKDTGTPSGHTDPKPAACSGEFARVEAPYGPNNSLSGWGGFAADEQGIVFSAFADTTLQAENDDTEYPQIVVAGDPSGNLKQIYSTTAGMISNVVIDAENVYFTVLIASSQLVSVPRAGGTPKVLVERGVRSGPLTDGKRLYYRGTTTDTFNDALFAIDKAGGAPTVLSDRGEKHLGSAAIEGGTLYFVDTEGFDAKNDDVLYTLEIATGKIAEMARLPPSTSGAIDVANGVVYSSLISESFDIEIYRIEGGKAPVLTASDGGLPLVLADGFAYYPARSGGINKDSLALDNPTLLPTTSGKQIFALAAGPTDIWYAQHDCIYRAPK